MQFVVAECGKLWRHHRVGLLSILIRIQSLQMRVEASLMMKLFALCDGVCLGCGEWGFMHFGFIYLFNFLGLEEKLLGMGLVYY